MLSKNRQLAAYLSAGFVGLYFVVMYYHYVSLELHQEYDTATPLQETKQAVWTDHARRPSAMRFEDFKMLAIELARLTPAETLRQLDELDPFGVRSLNASQSLRALPCPIHQRISLPDRRNHSRSAAFRDQRDGTFLYFQHLRKAGGTHFCTLAEDNLPKQNLPPYYCMPDYQWPSSRGGQKCAGCLHHYSNQEIASFLNAKHHRIAGNEWDSFDVEHHFDLDGAVYVTSFRDPANRAVSQFRFECLEHRGCNAPSFDVWWTRRRDLYNVYTWTFSDIGRQGSIMDDASKADQRANAMSVAMETIAQFHLVLNMEWLEDAEYAIQSSLGFANTQTLHKTVRPHNQGLKRKDSFDAPTFLNRNATFTRLRESLALDEILTDVARRLFLERLVCEDLGS